MAHLLSPEDEAFRAQFESCEFPAADFNHREHLRLAYIYLVDTVNDTETASRLMREAIHGFLEHLGVGPAKYHETITRAWILAVRHFMEATPDSDSAASFIEQNPVMLDSKIMMTHYSAELLFSDEARAEFVQPNLDPIPRYDE
jgi:hypothetical protein